VAVICPALGTVSFRFIVNLKPGAAAETYAARVRAAVGGGLDDEEDEEPQAATSSAAAQAVPKALNDPRDMRA
jgi:hypothetical protein